MSNTLIVYNGTPEQRTAAQQLWATATFPRGFLEGHQVKLHFTENVGSAYTARGGAIVMGAHHPPSSVGPILLHEVGHLGDFWCLTPADRETLRATYLQYFSDWNYLAAETWAHSFAHAYTPPDTSYPTYPIPAATVEEHMDACGDGVPDEPTFSDVPADHPYYDSIEWSAENGVTTGYPDGTYRPDDPVTRGEMAVFLKRAAGI